MTETSSKVSVVMAVYNEAEYISTAIESILRQTFEDFEFLIIDDGSSDKTPEIIKHYAERDGRIRHLVNETNKGLPTSLNRGIEAANGEYIARMDADDRSLPERFERQVEFLETNSDVHVVGCNVRVIGVNGEYFGDREFPQDGRDPDTLQQEGPQVAHPSVMMRRTSVRAVDGYRTAFKYAQDLDLWIRMARKYGPQFLYVLPQPLFEYRLSPSKYRRNQVRDIYASYAGKEGGKNPSLAERITQAIEQQRKKSNPAREKSMYQYTAGRLLLDRGQRLQAGRRFLSAMAASPKNIRAWYGCGLLILPVSLRRRVTI
jgi:glycosyltransferase involved in cell wall biosynthesis